MAWLTACGGVPAKTSAAAAQAPQQSTASAAAPGGKTLTGSVAETINSGGYTYVRLQTDKGDVWIAATEFTVKAGERLTAPLEMPMANFHSKTLNRDFPMIYFVSQVAREGEALAGPAGLPTEPAMMGSHQPVASATVESVPPAPGGLAIADVWTRRTSLAGTTILVRGKVVKVNNGIMGRNWIHLQDGSGSATDRTNDLTVTTSAEAGIGEIVTASGVLAVGKDFGAGYVYDAVLENAVITRK